MASISRARLDLWYRKCVRDHATPMVVLAIGHDAMAGQINVYVPSDDLFDATALEKALELTLEAVRSGRIQRRR